MTCCCALAICAAPLSTLNAQQGLLEPRGEQLPARKDSGVVDVGEPGATEKASSGIRSEEETGGTPPLTGPVEQPG